MRWHLGTMGFSYAAWVGAFYPPHTRPADYLAWYAQHFNAVELDTTFYAVPPVERVRKWAAMVPPGFKFCAKTPREITHDRSLSGAVTPMLSFLETMRELGDKLGAIVIQFPPTLTAREFGPLKVLLLSLPPDIPVAVEFRHRSWNTMPTVELLREAGCAWVIADTGEPRAEFSEIHSPARFIYARFLGLYGQYHQHDHERVDLSDRLARWRDRIAALTPDATTTYAFFNNDYTGYAVAACQKMQDLVGQRPPVVGAATAQQGELFG